MCQRKNRDPVCADVGKEEGRRNSENEQEQCRTSQQLVLPTPGGINQDAPASSLELDLHRGGVRGEAGSAGRSSTQGDRKREVHPDLQDGILCMRRRGWRCGRSGALNKRKKEKQPGK